MYLDHTVFIQHPSLHANPHAMPRMTRNSQCEQFQPILSRQQSHITNYNTTYTEYTIALSERLIKSAS